MRWAPNQCEIWIASSSAKISNSTCAPTNSPLLAAIESVSERIAEEERIEKLAQERYPQVGLLTQIKGVGTLMALTFLLTLEDPHRFPKSRDVGGYPGLQPGRRNSGQALSGK